MLREAPQWAMAHWGSSSEACWKARTASSWLYAYMNASPWSKYFCASGLDVATDRVCTPRPAYWMTLDLDGLSILVGSAANKPGPTTTAATSAINIRVVLDRMMHPPFMFVPSELCRANSPAKRLGSSRFSVLHPASHY